MGRSADAFHFLLGEWDMEMLVMPEGANADLRAISNVNHILDGAVLLDEIRHLDASGQVNFRGACFRTYVPDSDRWYLVWMMANVEGCSELRAEVVDGEIRTIGQGRDSGGKLVEGGATTTFPPMATPLPSTGRTTVERHGIGLLSRIGPPVAGLRGDAG